MLVHWNNGNGDAPKSELALRSSIESFERILMENELDVASPSTRQDRVRGLSVMVLRSIRGKDRWKRGGRCNEDEDERGEDDENKERRGMKRKLK